MHRTIFPAVVLFSLFLAARTTVSADNAAIPLVTGQDSSGELAGWKSFHEAPGTATGDVWRLAEDGVLICRGTPRGYLYTENDYTNFVLQLQWRWPLGKPGNGGVLVRMAGPHKIWPDSLEAQINAGSAGDFWALDGYPLSGQQARTKSVDHPQFGKLTNIRRTDDAEKPAGEWNTYEIVASGRTVILRINGREVNRTTDGAVRPGKICLTSEGDEIHFRRILLTPASTE